MPSYEPAKAQIVSMVSSLVERYHEPLKTAGVTIDVDDLIERDDFSNLYINQTIFPNSLNNMPVAWLSISYGADMHLPCY